MTLNQTYWSLKNPHDIYFYPVSELCESMNRIAVYIDGYNLYHSLENGFYDLLWLDIERLSKTFIDDINGSIDTEITFIKFFTAIWKNMPESVEHHENYFNALEATSGKKVIQYLGKFNKVAEQCPRCHETIYSQKEKHSDVNLALHMLNDAIYNEYDTALLISGDSDFVPAIRMIKGAYKNVIVNVLFPPGTVNTDLSSIADYSIEMSEKILEECQLPEVVFKNGTTFSKPPEWTRSYKKK